LIRINPTAPEVEPYLASDFTPISLQMGSMDALSAIKEEITAQE